MNKVKIELKLYKSLRCLLPAGVLLVGPRRLASVLDAANVGEGGGHHLVLGGQQSRWILAGRHLFGAVLEPNEVEQHEDHHWPGQQDQAEHLLAPSHYEVLAQQLPHLASIHVHCHGCSWLLLLPVLKICSH